MNTMKSVEERFKADVADHSIACQFASFPDGALPRFGSWRCTNNGSGIYAFNVTTWPSYIAISGDMHDFMWSRSLNMLAFVRGSVRSVGYFHEKLRAGDSREYNPDLCREWLAERRLELVDPEYEMEPDEQEAISEELNGIENAWGRDEGSEESFIRAISDSDSFHDWLCDGLDVRSYRYHYLWCTLALEWFAKRIDEFDVNLPHRIKGH